MSVLSDDDYRRYLFEYRFEGSEWALEIRARSLEEAEARLRAMTWARPKGEIGFSGRIPAGGLFVRIGRLLRNAISGKSFRV